MVQDKFHLWTCSGIMYEKTKCMNDLASNEWMSMAKCKRIKWGKFWGITMTIQSDLQHVKYCLRSTIKDNWSKYGNKTNLARPPATGGCSRSLTFVWELSKWGRLGFLLLQSVAADMGGRSSSLMLLWKKFVFCLFVLFCLILILLDLGCSLSPENRKNT